MGTFLGIHATSTVFSTVVTRNVLEKCHQSSSPSFPGPSLDLPSNATVHALLRDVQGSLQSVWCFPRRWSGPGPIPPFHDMHGASHSALHAYREDIVHGSGESVRDMGIMFEALFLRKGFVW